MATIALIAFVGGGLLLAVCLGWIGIQGLHGTRDSRGEMMPRETAIDAIVVAVFILAYTLTMAFLSSHE